jgi:hypothetical protein
LSRGLDFVPQRYHWSLQGESSLHWTIVLRRQVLADTKVKTLINESLKQLQYKSQHHDSLCRISIFFKTVKQYFIQKLVALGAKEFLL